MRKTKTIIIQGIIFSLIPALFSYLGQSGNILDYLKREGYLGNSIDINNVKNIFLVISIGLTFLLLTTNLIKAQLEENKFREQRNQLLKYNKSILIASMTKTLGKEYCDVNIRIFVPKKTVLWKIKHLFGIEAKLEFVIRNIDSLAEAGTTNDLKFKVEPKAEAEGLVGECYVKHSIIYDDDLENSNSTKYNLSDYQISKTSDLRFILACPLFNKDESVSAVVSFDSKNKIKISDKSKEPLRTAVANYSQQLYEYVPELFRSKGGFL